MNSTDCNPLQRLADRETFAEAVALLTPEQFAVAILRVEGLNDGQIANLLGITRRAVNSRMAAARRRIIAEVPELRDFLTGRARGSATGAQPPLERGFICTDPSALADLPTVPRYLTRAEVARLLNIKTSTVTARCRAGKYPGARIQDNRWLIPEDAIGPPCPDIDMPSPKSNPKNDAGSAFR